MNIDEMRRGIESMPVQTYEAVSYYERWLFTVETILTEKGVLAPGRARREGRGMTFAPGDRVRVADRAHAGHHRTPGYLKGKAGHDLPRAREVQEPRDTGVRRGWGATASSLPRRVRGPDVWPASASRDRVFADLFEHWLEPAS